MPLNVKITQAGLSWSKNRFMITAGVLGLLLFTIVLLGQFGILPALGMAFAGAFGLPRWMLTFLKKRRENKFLDGVPGCRRHHRARHQSRPAAARLPEDDHHRSAASR